MRLRSFTANSLPEAMHRVRDVLGPDAVILSSQPAEDGRGVRVTAALEDSPLETLIHDGAAGGPGGGPGGGAVSLDEISEALAYHRVPPALFDRLVGAAAALAANNDALALGGALDGEFTFTAPPETPTLRPFLLVGPPGAGKTATAAKLCARVRLAGGRASLITMDTVKSGGLAQVTAFAQALGAELLQAPDIDALADAVAACPEDHFVVVDTVGANPFDADDMDRLSLAAGAAGAAGADPVAVLPAGGDPADCAEAAVAFAEIGARRLIVTKIDAARRFGGLLSAAQAGRFALMAASASPNISDPLLPFNPVSLARLLLPAAVDSIQRLSIREAG
jgi:flagellar biosynthesis protein FlhF